MQAFLRKSEDVLQEFSVFADAGLTNEQILQSRESHGENTFTRAKKRLLSKEYGTPYANLW